MTFKSKFLSLTAEILRNSLQKVAVCERLWAQEADTGCCRILNAQYRRGFRFRDECGEHAVFAID